jgi:hypothetical protein
MEESLKYRIVPRIDRWSLTGEQLIGSPGAPGELVSGPATRAAVDRRLTAPGRCATMLPSSVATTPSDREFWPCVSGTYATNSSSDVLK